MLVRWGGPELFVEVLVVEADSSDPFLVKKEDISLLSDDFVRSLSCPPNVLLVAELDAEPEEEELFEVGSLGRGIAFDDDDDDAGGVDVAGLPRDCPFPEKAIKFLMSVPCFPGSSVIHTKIEKKDLNTFWIQT